MFKPFTTESTLPVSNSEPIEQLKPSNYSWKTLTKAGLVFVMTIGAFLTLKVTKSFSIMTLLLENTPKSDKLTGDKGTKIADDYIASGQIGESGVSLLHNFEKGQIVSLFPAVIELSNLDGTNGFKLNGEAAGDYSGLSVSAAGDINDDGIADLIVGARDANPSGRTDAGRSYVVFGHSGVWSSSVDLSSLDGSNGFKLDGETAGDYSGGSVSAVGDINGDGVADLIVGAYMAAPSGWIGAGRSYVVFGHNGTWPSSIELSSLDGTNGFKLNGEASYNYSGLSVSAGDINGDNIADLIIGASAATPPGRSYAGRSYVIFGHNGTWPSSIELSSLDGTIGFKLDGEAYDDHSGKSVSVGDINGDGVADLIVGAYKADPSGKSEAGRSYVIFGHSGTWTSPIGLSSLDGSNGFKLDGEAADDRSGISVSAAGDINGDGVEDLIIGAINADPSGRTDAGRSYVVFGHSGTWPSPIELSGLDGSNGFKLDGEAAGDYGGSVSAAGDINGDGVDDLIVGAGGADPSGRTDAGRSYVVFGHSGTWPSSIEFSNLNGSNGFNLDGEAAGDYTGDYNGHSVSVAGDINGDGVDDLIVGAYLADPSGQSAAGRSYVVFGRSAKFVSVDRSSNSLTGTTNPVGTIVGVIIGTSLVLCIVGGTVGYFLYRKNRKVELKEIDLEEENITIPKEDSKKERMSMLAKDGSISTSLIIPYKKLKLGQKIGGGGSGIVYKGRWQHTDVAVKQLHSIEFDPHAKIEFNREVSIMAALRHTNIVSLFGICFEPEFCIVMEYMEGGSLYSLLHSNEELPWSSRLHMAMDITRGLAYLHEKDIVHRDLKSLNVLLTKDRQAKLTDFGLSKEKTGMAGTMTKGLIGTARWIAPELMDVEKYELEGYTKKADIYSYGMILYELSSRLVPFQEDDNEMIVMKKVEQGSRPKIPEDCPEVYGILLSHCWRQRSETRPDINGAMEALEACCEELPTEGTPECSTKGV